MDRIVVEHVYKDRQFFRLSLVWNECAKAYNYLELEWLGKYVADSINIYFLKCFSEMGQIKGKYELDKNIEKDIKEWLTKNKSML
jgi:hypothetical protein